MESAGIKEIMLPRFDPVTAARVDGYYYLASPYSKYPDGIDAAFIEVCRAAGYLVSRGVRVYCPIAHTHPIAIHSNQDPLDHEIWVPLDRPLMGGAVGLVVYEMDTWRDSYGIALEVHHFHRVGKPIYGMEVL